MQKSQVHKGIFLPNLATSSSSSCLCCVVVVLVEVVAVMAVVGCCRRVYKTWRSDTVRKSG